MFAGIKNRRNIGRKLLTVQSPFESIYKLRMANYCNQAEPSDDQRQST